MLRQGNTRPLHWADKTMSVLRADQLEACEKDLSSLPFVCLFDPNCTDTDAESFYDLSYFPAEDKGKPPVLHTVDELRVRVLSSFAPELALLSMEEHDLLVRLALFGGTLTLQDWNELIPARSLLRRLWCAARLDNGSLTLRMPHQLCASALLLLAGDEHKKIRDAVTEVHNRIDNTLYLMGAMKASGPENHLRALLKETYAADRPDLIRRMLYAGYDYVYDDSGALVLIHPGLADPDCLIHQLSSAMQGFTPMELTGDALSDAAGSIDDLENPLYDRMLSVLAGAVRPELDPEDAVEDLIILAKQGVSYADMEEVLSSMLVSLPTEEMLKTLNHLSGQIPRWLHFSSSRVQ